MENFRKISLSVFNLYDNTEWEKTAFFDESGGFLVTSYERILMGCLNKQEYEKYEKERRICLNYAWFGFQVEHLAERMGYSSYDVNLIGASCVKINGLKADLKSTSTANNIVRYAKKAVRKQGADIVLFEFQAISAEMLSQLFRLSSMGIHGYYYALNEMKLQEF